MAADEKKKLTWVSEIKSEREGETDYSYAQVTCHTEDVKDIGNADKYLFEIRRYKVKDTKEEYLNVKVYETKKDDTGKLIKSSNDVCAEIEQATIIELESKLLNLRIYGILLDRKHFPKVRQVIEKAYPSLSIHTVNNSTDVTKETIKAIYEMFVRYIRETEIIANNGLYNIPVDEFKDYLSDTEYSKYKYSDIRKQLAEYKVEGKEAATKCSYGRNDNTIAKGDKRIKVISFVAKVLDSYQITELPEISTEKK